MAHATWLHLVAAQKLGTGYHAAGMRASGDCVTPPATVAALRPLTQRQRRALLVGAIVAAAAFLGLALLVRSAGLIPLDAEVQQVVQGQRSSIYERPVRMITQFGSGWVLIPAATLGCAVVAVRYRGLAMAFALTAAGTFAIMGIAKGLIGRPRPNDWGYAYPSGHVLGIVVFCGMLLYALWLFRVSRLVRMATASLSAVVVVAVAVSRLYVKSHWFTDIVGPDTRDICYATQNRQAAVRELSDHVDVLLVVGAKNSSNSNRLREIGEEVGIPSFLIASGAELPAESVRHATAVGITAGASAPDVLVEDVIEALRRLGPVEVSTMPGREEKIQFRLPAELA